jgi:renalase
VLFRSLAAAAILQLSRSEPCLALLSVYPEATAAPSWQLALPEDSSVLRLTSNESSKRRLPSTAVVFQAHPAWSRRHAGDPGWPQALLEEAGRLFGPWAAAPRLTQERAWRFARNGLAAELSAPMLLRLRGGGRIGLCGDRFGRGGGIEGAWISGRALARRILAETASTGAGG